MCISPSHFKSGTCLLLGVLLGLMVSTTAHAANDRIGKQGKDKGCGCRGPLVEAVMPAGAVDLEEVAGLAACSGGTAGVSADGAQIVAELPLSVVKALSERGIAVVPAERSLASGQPKAGDRCATADPIEAGITYTGATTWISPQAWFSFTPAESGTFQISLEGSDFDTALYVYDACDGNPLAFDDDGGPALTSRLVMPMEAGTSYFILIEGFWGDAGNYVLLVEPRVLGPGEMCLSAIPAELETVYEGTTTDDASQVWYALAPTQSGDFVVSLEGSDFDTVLAVYTDCNGSQVAYNDDAKELYSRLSLYAHEGTTYFIRISGWADEVGTYRLQITSVTPPANDTVADATPLTAGSPHDGVSDGATSTLASSMCGYFDSRDVWYSHVPAETGFVSIELIGRDFDPTLVVFDQYRGLELACNDDVNDCSFDSTVCMQMMEGTMYLIRVAGYDGTTGHYTLTVNRIVQALPATTGNPSPPDRADGVSTETVLTWKGSSSPSLAAAHSQDKQRKPSTDLSVKGIYGRDDRLDEYDVQDEAILGAGDATVLLLDRSSLQSERSGYVIPFVPTLGDEIPSLCSDEPFRDQPSIGWCSGFLVAPDLIVTAGHCWGCGDDIKNTAVVFGYTMRDSETPVTTFDADDVYFCEEVVAGQSGTPDWALIRLDRPVSGHTPLRLRKTGFIPEKQPLLVVGHPSGLPRKYDMGGSVRENWMLSYFSANLDTFGGSSGSAVLNLENLVVEGILVQGEVDYVDDPSGTCIRSSVCPDTGCPLWEDSTRVTAFSSLVLSYDVYMGLDPGKLALVDSGNAAAEFRPSTLKPEQTYYWQIVSRNSAGEVTGPVWSFTTAP